MHVPHVHGAHVHCMHVPPIVACHLRARCTPAQQSCRILRLAPGPCRILRPLAPGPCRILRQSFVDCFAASLRAQPGGRRGAYLRGTLCPLAPGPSHKRPWPLAPGVRRGAHPRSRSRQGSGPPRNRHAARTAVASARRRLGGLVGGARGQGAGQPPRAARVHAHVHAHLATRRGHRAHPTGASSTLPLHTQPRAR